MAILTHSLRQRAQCSAILLMLLVSMMPTPVHAAAQDASIYLRPHCEKQGGNPDSIFGEVPDYGGLKLFEERCSRFTAKDPQTLKTDILTVGDTLDMDIVVRNPSDQPISHVRAWLSFDPNVLEGTSVEIEDTLPSITPGENTFDTTNGYVMIEGSNDASNANATGYVRVARVQFTVKQAPPSGTFISFYDIQPGGHTTVTTSQDGTDSSVLGEDPGGLHVVFADSGSSGDVSSGNPTDATSPVPVQSEQEEFIDPGGPAPTPAFGAGNAPAAPPRDPFANEANAFGDPNTDRLTQTSSTTPSDPFATQAENPFGTPGDGDASVDSKPQAEKTAFSLLQVRNIRTTTEGTSIYLAWDPLNSSTLKAYNVYYGTTTGRYIQRKTVDKELESVILRSLPLDTKYFMAVRAVSIQDEESAFSQEVAVTVGDPDSSTALLVPGEGDGIATSPIDASLLGSTNGQIPGGDTGAPSSIALFLLVSAILGTLLASRRQLAVSPVS